MTIREGFVESEGHRLAYFVANEHLKSQDNEPVIVFIHGVLASYNFWRACGVSNQIKENRTWYSLSLPAHSPSKVPADFSPDQVDDQWFFRVMNAALLRLLGDRKAIVVGHSTGGFSAINLAINHAPNLIGFISVAGFHSGKWGGVEGLLVKMARFRAKALFTSSIAISKVSSLMQAVFPVLLAHDWKTYRENPLSKSMLEAIQPDYRKSSPSALYALFHGISKLDISNQLHQIKVPSYLFVGTDDPVVPPKQSLLLAGRIPNTKTEVFKEVGHMPFMEKTEQYLEALDEAIEDMMNQVSD